MKIADRLDKDQKNKLNSIRDKPMIKKDWLELMGVHRDTYKRSKGGVFKNNRT
ncbi:hypothetical protein [Saliterribacillus persicus]|uniref:Uncharacterized protein n=1 Tax=Saliterribacillus persicus TaxID=930114 RepID=A0A368XVU1_9BACI|nr:hypothetical protein [Saliterribacillus persicus]RCW70627.1 hypothetical protein DFR57_10624 [Saliterribacillus persicus]